MDSKILLGKYRVAAEEIEAAGEVADSPVAYEAEEIDSGKKVIVEVIPAGALKKAVRDRLEAEAVAAEKMNHANIPALYDFGVEDDQLVYVMENFEGTLADEWVNARGPLPVGPVLRIASQVVSALGAAAFHGIAHHAINPSNLVLVPGQTAEGEWPLVKILHFVGVVPKSMETDVAVAAFDKSLHYASPEQIQKGTVDFRSEIFSLGSTMWFLLTGTPPLTTPKGPAAASSVQAGPAEEKINALPAKIRHLLAQMMSENPEARPRDPLAFYQKLQDCLHQVEQRETITPKSQAPAVSPILVDRTAKRRPSPLRALARVAILLAMAALTAFVLREYLRHRRIVTLEEPIGKPIGVPEASVSATPVIANTNATASNIAPLPSAPAESSSLESASAKETEPLPANALLPATDSVVIAATAPAAETPAPPAMVDAPNEAQTQEPAPAAANNASTLPAATDSREVASSEQPKPTPAESPAAEVAAVVQQTESKKTIMREVRRAEPADDEPEVRRAEPAPEEDADTVAAETAPPSRQPSNSVARTEKRRPVKRAELVPKASATPDVIIKEPTPKPKRQAREKIYLPVPVR